MTKQYTESLQRYQIPGFEQSWGAIHRGIERESLRVTSDGRIAQTPHPAALGSALTNPFITTDFSESLLEFITPAFASIDECLKSLEDIHRFSLQILTEGEILWTSSMPCPLSGEADIPLAEYGSSNIGRLKKLYRKGLHNRYGSLMQIIAGLHYNFSMPEDFWPAYQKIKNDKSDLQDFRTQQYLHLIRNFHRNSWILLFLFGASPAACKCFVKGRSHTLQEFDAHSLYLPYATCLRMGNLGYKSEAQKSLFVCYNELESYVECLHKAMHTPFADYEAIGQKQNGEYMQMNTNLLQLENEFYSTIRPKRVAKNGERPLQSLMRGGIEYIEVRALDLNPYMPLGIDAEQIRFLDTFLLHCLLGESPECNEREFFQVASNISQVVERGRDPALILERDGESVKLTDWAAELLDDLDHAAALLDEAHGGSAYQDSLDQQKAKLANPDLTPSGQILREMQQQGLSFYEFGMQHSKAITQSLQDNGLDSTTREMMLNTASESVRRQQEIEASGDVDFDAFLAQWNA